MASPRVRVGGIACHVAAVLVLGAGFAAAQGRATVPAKPDASAAEEVGDPATSTIAEVVVLGLDEDEARNVRSAVSLARLSERQRGRLSEPRLRFLLRRVPAEVTKALEPFGWYAPAVDVRREAKNGALRIVIDVKPGEPVRVKTLAADIDGAARDDRFVMRELPKIRPRAGERFVHADYEAAKQHVDRKLAERGYFQAEAKTQRVEVSRAAKTADIALRWDSGPRFRMGEARFGDTGFRPGLFEPLVDWKPGDTFHRNRLLRLQRRLAQLDYFALIDVAPDEEASVGDAVRDDLQVPIDITTTPAKRTSYAAAVSFGTDSGPGLRGGLNRRWVNQRGHKWAAEAEWSDLRTGLSTQYRIPSLRWMPGWYVTELGYIDEDQDGVLGFERTSARVGWRGQDEPWTLSLDLVAARERTRSRTRIFIPTQRVAYPELAVQYRQVDDPVWPEEGLQLRGVLRAGLVDDGFESRRFAQLTLGAQWLRTFGERQRLLLRADAGGTALGGEGEFTGFPTSLRYFAGGDRSIRGYGYREIGPRFEGEVLGGLHLLTASAEFQHFFNERWGAAAFVDAGDAFNTRRGFDPKVGVGVGARWRSPVGLVGIDVAQGLEREAGGGTRLHLSFGVTF